MRYIVRGVMNEMIVLFSRREFHLYLPFKRIIVNRSVGDDEYTFIFYIPLQHLACEIPKVIVHIACQLIQKYYIEIDPIKQSLENTEYNSSIDYLLLPC